ncbi:MAG: hypothetical protein ACOC54_00385 [Candidatus Sumerlaeota bacterium]
MKTDREAMQEQAEEIHEKEKARKKGCRRSMGCLVVVLVVALAAGYMYRDQLRAFFDSDFYDRVGEIYEDTRQNIGEKADTLSDKSPRELLTQLKDMTNNIQEIWGDGQAREKMAVKLEAIRAELVQQRDNIEEGAREKWDDVIDGYEELIQKAKDKVDVDPEKLKELRDKVTELDKLRNLTINDEDEETTSGESRGNDFP